MHRRHRIKRDPPKQYGHKSNGIYSSMRSMNLARISNRLRSSSIRNRNGKMPPIPRTRRKSTFAYCTIRHSRKSPNIYVSPTVSFEGMHSGIGFIITLDLFRCDEKGSRIVCVDQFRRNATQSATGQSEIIYEITGASVPWVCDGPCEGQKLSHKNAIVSSTSENKSSRK